MKWKNKHRRNLREDMRYAPWIVFVFGIILIELIQGCIQPNKA